MVQAITKNIYNPWMYECRATIPNPMTTNEKIRYRQLMVDNIKNFIKKKTGTEPDGSVSVPINRFPVPGTGLEPEPTVHRTVEWWFGSDSRISRTKTGGSGTGTSGSWTVAVTTAIIALHRKRNMRELKAEIKHNQSSKPTIQIHN